MSPITTPATFSLDTPALNPAMEACRIWGSQVEFSGWCYEEPVSAAAQVLLELTDEATGMQSVVVCEKVARPDVAEYLSDPAALGTGFRVLLSTGSLRPGTYSASLIVASNGHTSRIENVAKLKLMLHEFELAARAGLAAKFLKGDGIEIGALQRKLPLPEGCRVQYIDRMPLEELFIHYPELSNFSLQAPDIIDDGEKLAKIADSSQDFVVANHFLEHSRNPLQTLFNLARVLKPGGILYMAVPDKRFTKDAPRPVTRYETLKHTLLTGIREETEAAYREWAVCWENAQEPHVQEVADKLKSQDYSIHFNIWRLADLLELIFRARNEFQLPFEITSVVSSENENILILTRD